MHLSNEAVFFLWVNSCSVIALAGQFALYRDLYLGARGDDVRMVQQALADLGYDVGVDGELGAGTADAVRDLYRRGKGTSSHPLPCNPSRCFYQPRRSL